MYVNDYRDISEQERIIGTHAVLYAVRMAKRCADDVESYFTKSIIDEYKLDYRGFKKAFHFLAGQWDEVYRTEELFETLSVFEEQPNTFDSLQGLLGKINDANYEIHKNLLRIDDVMDSVGKLIEKYETDREERNKKIQELYDEYKEKPEFKERRSHYLGWVTSQIKVLGKTLESYNGILYSIEELGGSLLRVHLERRDVGTYIIENRKNLTQNDIQTYFFFKEMHDAIMMRIERFEYEGECSPAYRGMFKNKAAEELTFALVKVMHDNVDKLKGNMYGVVMLALTDMKLINKGQYGKMFMDFINDRILVENGDVKIADAKTITGVTKNVKNHPFKKLTIDDTKDSTFTESLFPKYSDIYWQCISIINKVTNEDLMLQGFAMYLQEEHERTPDIKVFKEIGTLRMLYSVLKGEEPEF